MVVCGGGGGGGGEEVKEGEGGVASCVLSSVYLGVWLCKRYGLLCLLHPYICMYSTLIDVQDTKSSKPVLLWIKIKHTHTPQAHKKRSEEERERL